MQSLLTVNGIKSLTVFKYWSILVYEISVKEIFRRRRLQDGNFPTLYSQSEPLLVFKCFVSFHGLAKPFMIQPSLRRANSFPGQLANKKRPHYRGPLPSQRRYLWSDVYTWALLTGVGRLVNVDAMQQTPRIMGNGRRDEKEKRSWIRKVSLRHSHRPCRPITWLQYSLTTGLHRPIEIGTEAWNAVFKWEIRIRCIKLYAWILEGMSELFQLSTSEQVFSSKGTSKFWFDLPRRLLVHLKAWRDICQFLYKSEIMLYVQLELETSRIAPCI